MRYTVCYIMRYLSLSAVSGIGHAHSGMIEKGIRRIKAQNKGCGERAPMLCCLADWLHRTGARLSDAGRGIRGVGDHRYVLNDRFEATQTFINRHQLDDGGPRVNQVLE